MIEYLRITKMMCGWRKLCCVSHCSLEFCFGTLFSNLFLDALSSSEITLLGKMAGSFTLSKSWQSLSIPHGAMGWSVTVAFPGHIIL